MYSLKVWKDNGSSIKRLGIWMTARYVLNVLVYRYLCIQLIEGLTGERAIFKRRGEKQPEV